MTTRKPKPPQVRQKTTPTSRVEYPPMPKGGSVTRSPTVYNPDPRPRTIKGGQRGGYIVRDSRGRVIGTQYTEDSPIKPVRRPGKTQSRNS